MPSTPPDLFGKTNYQNLNQKKRALMPNYMTNYNENISAFMPL